ncbi:MAG: ribonuclease Y [Nitrospirae bacterium CG18_big_fil_WC_8_21_14_2_50_70_55]|nr:ribonuclease Y [Deltaproteobacteria bacterium]OIP62958.1 MAG: ribonuclease Y [Nitrospirae bacterium CG2_30_70_394]PIQ05714.1 MAG: ribonuclease Y [Nitrospirae bacterium CG18_big_fil_WC_8_21_14_2_50_70_55]PIU79527.1 MAG: ribonuclease Y [Nitrospirae bacterium CG06_land_8_20_14_3_00_70_43]PIW83801.1 MAG: ribonuclease Y [Nitrospirae bacterium CG_4_8_14_3_um_filter_70_85]PIX82218.1 MAG: ribonuclease Y [Nitrospirae bacterium CG_4_10_14_3_um_filter_70_108]PJB96787.1 MAG: ribonuclease Y [Nitrospira
MEIVIAILGAIAGAAVGAIAHRLVVQSHIGSTQQEVARITERALATNETSRKEAELERKELLSRAELEAERLRNEAHKAADQIHKTLGDERTHLAAESKRLTAEEQRLSQRNEALERREHDVEKTTARLHEKEQRLDRLIEDRVTELANIAHLSVEKAKEELTRHLEEEARHEAAWLITQIEDEARQEGDARAQKIMSLAMQRMASDHVSEHAISVVPLPSEEMKGRIIGREGRNIRAFEAATGIDVVIDDTPDAVVVSGFNSVRREVARMALGRLVKDGRIHPAHIEETVAKCQEEIEKQIIEAGKRVVYEIDVQGLHPELIKLLGRLNYRTSFGQNQLDHAKEVALLSGIMASELGCDAAMARRAGLLHDIGKAVDQEMEGDHAHIGADLAKRYKEPETVINAILYHHAMVEPNSVESILVAAADALSAARPGARMEAAETHVKRLTDLERIASNHDGIEKAYAIQAGREIRVIVDTDKMGDAEARLAAKEIAEQIQKEMIYPGQIKVVAIRESRFVEFAR